jgi:hypothetical protein
MLPHHHIHLTRSPGIPASHEKGSFVCQDSSGLSNKPVKRRERPEEYCAIPTSYINDWGMTRRAQDIFKIYL